MTIHQNPTPKMSSNYCTADDSVGLKIKNEKQDNSRSLKQLFLHILGEIVCIHKKKSFRKVAKEHEHEKQLKGNGKNQNNPLAITHLVYHHNHHNPLPT